MFMWIDLLRLSTCPLCTCMHAPTLPRIRVGPLVYFFDFHLQNFTVPSYFIATQGPLQNTIGDFWAMVWKYECNSIVMLSNLREKAQVSEVDSNCNAVQSQRKSQVSEVMLWWLVAEKKKMRLPQPGIN